MIDSKKRFLLSFLSVALFLFLSVGWSYLHFYPIHDAANYAGVEEGADWQISLGRFLIPVYLMLRGASLSPLLTGLFSLVFLGLSVFFISLLLRQRSGAEVFLTGALLSASLFVLEINAVHQYYADVFLLSLLLACAGTYLVSEKRGFFSFLAGVVLFVLSFGLYPAFLTTAAVLLLTGHFLKWLQEPQPFGKLCRSFFYGAAALFAGGVLYLLLSRAALSLAQATATNTDNSIFSAGHVPLQALIASAIQNYKAFFLAFGLKGFFAGWPGFLALGLLGVLAFAMLIACCKKRGRRGLILLFLLIAAVFPGLSRLVNIFSLSTSAFRTAFAQFLLAPFLLSLIFSAKDAMREGAPEKKGRGAAAAAVLLSALMVLGSVWYANRAFAAVRYLYEQAVAHTERVLADLDALPIEAGTDIVVLGVFELPDDSGLPLAPYRDLEGLSQSTGVTYPQVFYSYTRLLGREIRQCESSGEALLAQAAQMPAYPAEGYIRQFGDAVIVKLSE